MIRFTNVNDLNKYLDKLAKQTIQKDQTIKDVVVDELVASIEKNVYEPYTPSPSSPYERQKNDGGLTDRRNFATDLINDGIAIYSTREGMDRAGSNVYVAEIIEGMEGHDYSVRDVWNYGYEQPRHFVKPAKDELEKTGKVVHALKEALKRQGLDVK